AEGFSNGIATQGGINTTMSLWALSLRDQERDPTSRDIDNEAQGLAAESAARQNAGRGGRGGADAATAPPPDVRIDWNGLARRARRIPVTGPALGGLTPAPEGHAIALNVSTPASGGRGQAPLGDSGSGIYIVDVESGQLTRVPPAPAAAAEEGVVTPGGPPAAGLGSGVGFARDGRRLHLA